jgi:protein-S-isoprenylcysteine O-methyltransferase Ste14
MAKAFDPVGRQDKRRSRFYPIRRRAVSPQVGWQGQLPAGSPWHTDSRAHRRDGFTQATRSDYTESVVLGAGICDELWLRRLSGACPTRGSVGRAVVANGLAVLSVVILVYALLSLGTSISFVPSQRDNVTRGDYRLVRHPIYTGAFIALLVFIVRACSLVNLEIAVTLIVVLMIRSVVEERFLRADATYAAYLRQGAGAGFLALRNG